MPDAREAARRELAAIWNNPAADPDAVSDAMDAFEIAADTDEIIECAHCNAPLDAHTEAQLCADGDYACAAGMCRREMMKEIGDD